MTTQQLAAQAEKLELEYARLMLLEAMRFANTYGDMRERNERAVAILVRALEIATEEQSPQQRASLFTGE